MADRWREEDERWRRPRDRDDVRYAGETILGRADWGDRESDYEHGFRPTQVPGVRDGTERDARRPRADSGGPRQERESWGRESYAGRGPRGYQRTDVRVWEDVCARLTDDPRVDATDVEVRVENGEVTLEGTVRSREEKRRAEDAIESISGVRDVHNHLRVAHGGIGERGAPQTPLGISSPGGESRTAVKRQSVSARATAREQSARSRGRRPR
jgi:hypothetical protein